MKLEWAVIAAVIVFAVWVIVTILTGDPVPPAPYR